MGTHASPIVERTAPNDDRAERIGRAGGNTLDTTAHHPPRIESDSPGKSSRDARLSPTSTTSSEAQAPASAPPQPLADTKLPPVAPAPFSAQDAWTVTIGKGGRARTIQISVTKAAAKSALSPLLQTAAEQEGSYPKAKQEPARGLRREWISGCLASMFTAIGVAGRSAELLSSSQQQQSALTEMKAVLRALYGERPGRSGLTLPSFLSKWK